MVDEEEIDAGYRQYAIEEYRAIEEPFYVPISDEVEFFEAAFDQPGLGVSSSVGIES